MVEQESSRQEKVENGERLLAGVQVLAVRTSLSCGLLSTYYSLPFAVGAMHGIHLREAASLPEGRRFLGTRVCALTETFPGGYGFLSDQLNRASLSIAANLAERNGRFTKADRGHFFTMARGSILECVPLLELARRRGLLPDAGHDE